MVINLQQDTHSTFQYASDTCPCNIHIAYSAKQTESKKWMLSQSFADTIMCLVKLFSHF